MKLNEYNINGSKYNVEKIRHYTSIKNLLSILKLGYIRPHKSRGDKDFSNFITEEDTKAVCFLDSNIDVELESILSQNDRQSTIEGLTYNLALHMKEISALIEVDLDKYDHPENIKLLGNFKYLYNNFINNWNDAIKEFRNNLNNKLDLINLRKAYKEGGEEGYYSYFNKIKDSEYKDWLKWARTPDDRLLNTEMAEMDLSTYKRGSKYNFKELTPELAEELNRRCEDCDLAGVYKILMKLGIDKELIRHFYSDVGWLLPQKIRDALGRFGTLLSNSKSHSPIELRSNDKVLLNKGNSVIYVFTGLAKGTGQDVFLPQLKAFEDKYNIKYIEPGEKLNEKMFRTANKLTYEEACDICKTPRRFLDYIRKHKDTYYTIGEFDKVESALQYITDFVYGGKYTYSDYLEMIQVYFDEILPLGKNEDVDIYRGVRLNNEEDFDWSDIGNCWCYEWDSCLEFLDYFTEKDKKPFILTASTNRDNIDWITSICLNLTHVNEKELRLYDADKIDDPSLEEADYYMESPYENIEEKGRNMFMKKYRESTPLEDRDDYQAWKAQHDDEEAQSTKDKYRGTLKDRNSSIYQAWNQFLMSLNDHAFEGRGEGFKDFIEDGSLLQTGYFDSFAFYTPGFDVHDEETGGIGIGIWYKKGGEAGGDVFDEFIPNLKKHRGVSFYITAAVSLPEDSEVSRVTDSERQQLNIYTKEIVASGKVSRKEVAGLVQFFKEVIDGNAGKYFPGARNVYYSGLEGPNRPAVLVEYEVPVIPDIDDDKTYDIIRGAEKLYKEIRPVLG